MDTTLQELVAAWIAGDPDPATRAELEALVREGDEVELRDRFDGRLEFGTAGIRGEVAAGPNRINLAVVRQTAWGLGRFLLDRRAGSGTIRVVVGNDARPDSPRFAADVAAVLAAMGIEVSRFDVPVPTPLVAWLARSERADAAVVVTASHNPRPDNGIKVYDDRSIQIVPPWDVDIAAAIDRAPPPIEIPLAPDEVKILDRGIEADYRAQIVARLPEADRDARDLVVVATALHGVGAPPLGRLLGEIGQGVVQVPEQEQPDGTFPTVAFPNPEEPGALDLALALARRAGADLVLANDPDADRLAVCLPDGDGGHRPLTGNEVGALLGDALLEEVDDPSRCVVASSIVSSPQLGVIAARAGAEHRSTLTGFKWVWTALLDAEEHGHVPLFGYEEALGYAVDPHVRDKDGLSAALAVVDLARREAARGRTLGDRLDDLARSTGLWVSIQSSVRLEGDEWQERLSSAMDGLRAAPPEVFAHFALLRFTDYLDGARERPVWLGAQDLLAFDLAAPFEGEPVVARLLIRPSGTEPKVKAYVDLHLDNVDPTEPRAAQPALLARAREVGTAALEALGVA